MTAVKWLEVHIDTNHTGLEPVETMLSALGIDGVVILSLIHISEPTRP